MSPSAPIARAMPPYAGPAAASAGNTLASDLGPYVPPIERARVLAQTGEGHFTSTLTPVARSLAVPAQIPPYRPVQHTLRVAPVERTPLYIPPASPTDGIVLQEDEAGLIAPVVMRTEEVAASIAPASVTDSDVPWIDRFLATTSPVAADEWPLEAAAAEFRALRLLLGDPQAVGATPPLYRTTAGAGRAGTVPAPLPEWTDTDLTAVPNPVADGA